MMAALISVFKFHFTHVCLVCNTLFFALQLPKDALDTLVSLGYKTGRSNIQQVVQAPDGTCKFLLQLHDGRIVETVGIPEHQSGRLTVCVSSQVMQYWAIDSCIICVYHDLLLYTVVSRAWLSSKCSLWMHALCRNRDSIDPISKLKVLYDTSPRCCRFCPVAFVLSDLCSHLTTDCLFFFKMLKKLNGILPQLSSTRNNNVAISEIWQVCSWSGWVCNEMHLLCDWQRWICSQSAGAWDCRPSSSSPRTLQITRQ